MMIKVTFGDSELWGPIMSACQDLLDEFVDGPREYEEAKKQYGRERIRRAIVMGAYGHKVSNAARKFCVDEAYALVNQEKDLKYLNSIIEMEDVENLTHREMSSGACYIDIEGNKVHIK